MEAGNLLDLMVLQQISFSMALEEVQRIGLLSTLSKRYTEHLIVGRLHY